MKEIKTSELNVGDVIYNCISVSIGWKYIGAYYRKEVVTRITPKRTKIVTDYGDYKAYHTFFEYSAEMDETNSETIAKKKIYNSVYSLERMIKIDGKHKTLSRKNLLKVAEMLSESVEILKGEEE